MAQMKLPNGNGSVTKMSGKRRKPYIVWAPSKYENVNGIIKRTRKTIGFAKTYKEGYQMLMDYLKAPYDLNKSNYTFKKLYDEWSVSHYMGVSKSTQSAYRTALKYCAPLYNRQYKDIKLGDYQMMLDEAKYSNGKPLSQDSIKRIKKFLHLISEYAIKNDIIIKDCTQYIDTNKYKDRECKTVVHKVFTDDEITKLWFQVQQDNRLAKIIICMIYTGARVDREFFNIKIEDVDFNNHTISIKQSKTKNGIRLIPIADVIFPIIKDFANSSPCDYLFYSVTGNRIDYRCFLDEWHIYLDSLNMKHLPYDTRHTFNSMLANKGIVEEDRNILMGHSSGGVNEKVYTHRSIERLLNIVNTIC